MVAPQFAKVGKTYPKFNKSLVQDKALLADDPWNNSTVGVHEITNELKPNNIVQPKIS